MSAYTLYHRGSRGLSLLPVSRLCLLRARYAAMLRGGAPVDPGYIGAVLEEIDAAVSPIVCGREVAA